MAHPLHRRPLGEMRTTALLASDFDKSTHRTYCPHAGELFMFLEVPPGGNPARYETYPTPTGYPGTGAPDDPEVITVITLDGNTRFFPDKIGSKSTSTFIADIAHPGLHGPKFATRKMSLDVQVEAVSIDHQMKDYTWNLSVNGSNDTYTVTFSNYAKGLYLLRKSYGTVACTEWRRTALSWGAEDVDLVVTLIAARGGRSLL
ncbi:hypothetical protein DFH06DRAFT_1370331 [Mycena polygramma]|nr:hypothetical protein DFH06DRAFT_1370331 [Mycena polygramma]